MNTQDKLFIEEFKILSQKFKFDFRYASKLLSDTIPNELYHKIKVNAPFSLAGASKIKLIEPTIDLQVFYNFITSNHSLGFRVYPAFDSSNNNLYFMIANSVSEVDPHESFNIFPFLRTKYDALDPSEAIGEVLANNRLKDYFEHVMIENIPQVKNQFYKSSRYYAIADFDAFLATNQVNGNLGDYDVKIELGYITSTISKNEIWNDYHDEFNWPFPVDTDHMGFTCILILCEKNTGNKTGLALEIGHPCPPQCGSLTF